MFDRTIGLIGLALTIIALVAPYRWPKMHRTVVDLGLFAGAALLVAAFQPLWAPLFYPPLTPLVEAPLPPAPPPDPSLPKDQQQIQSLKAQLASVQNEFARTKDLLAIEQAVQGWGIFSGGTFYMKIDASKFTKYSNKLKLMMIVRFAYSNVDRMSDTYIGKSQFYSVSNSLVTLTRQGFSGLQLSGQDLTAEYDLIGFPDGFANTDKIASLSDAEKLGGVILAGRLSEVTFGHQQQVASALATSSCPK